MNNPDLLVLETGRQWSADGDVWLCTVLSTYGSSPRPPGAMMVIRQDGSHSGSLSGGCVEENFLLRIRQGEFSASSQVVRYGEGGLEPDRSLPCGGSLDILVEKLPAGMPSVGYFRKMSDVLLSFSALKKTLHLPDPCLQLERASYTSSTVASRVGKQITLTLSTPPRLVLCGLSSVAVYCANFGVSLGFETIVCEHRDEVRTRLAPLLDPGVRMVEQFPAAWLEREGCHEATAILSLTHDPRIDDLSLMEAVRLPAFYIGAMGSLKNSVRRKARLEKIADLSPHDLQRIHAPVGIDIGSKTPPEIALSVMADIVRYKNGRVSLSVTGVTAHNEDTTDENCHSAHGCGQEQPVQEKRRRA